MDDFVSALLCLPFLILPLIVLIGIISRKIEASGMLKELWGALQSRIRENRHKAADFPKQKAMEEIHSAINNVVAARWGTCRK